MPEDLARRMARAKDVNWSALACDAFELELGRIAESKSRKTMQDVIDRLRGTAKVANDESYNAGHRRGRLWAERFAKWHQLQRLAEGVEQWTEEEQLAYHAFQALDESLYDAAEDWFDEEFSLLDISSFTSAVRGWVDGAISVYEAVADEIE